MPSALSKKWEKRLAKHGLANRQFDDKGVISQPVAAPESTGIQTHQFDSALESYGWKASAGAHVGEEELARFHEIPVRIYHRDTPPWALSDEALRKLLLSLYPNLNTSERERACAARTCALAYRYFRMCEPAGSIAGDLNLPIRVIHRRIERIKSRAETLGL